MRVKKIVLAVLLAGASGLVANDGGFYVSADVGNTAFDGDVSWSTGSEKIKGDGTSITAKLGYYLNNNNRFYAAIEQANIYEAKIVSAGIGYDYLIGNNAFKPFIGALAGHSTIKPDDGSESTDGMYYGAQAGLNYAVNQNFSLEAGYRFMKADMESTFIDSDGVNTVQVDTIKNWFAGVNYKF